MVERLSSLDASFVFLDEPGTPMHVGGLLVLETPPGGLDALAALIEARLALVPRYRQRVAVVPGHLANPVWVDDQDFDLSYHLRRSGLPRPGTEAQLLDLVSRLTSRPLDRNRPLWEAYLIEGLGGNRVAVMTKTHPALVDGLSAIDIGQVLLDVDPGAVAPEPVDWRPARAPGGTELVLQALDEYLRRPSAVVETVRAAVADVGTTAGRVGSIAGSIVRTVSSTVLPAPRTPLNSPVGRQRRVAVARARLDDIKRIRTVHGGTVNDVLLTAVTGALREWLLSRGEPVVSGTSVRALVPMALQEDEAGAAPRVSSRLVDLPVGEPNPRVRLARLGYAMRGLGGGRSRRSADHLIALTGFAPSTLHALGARAARGLSRRMFNLVITNVPGPQVPLYAAGGEMLEVFPVVPLARGQGLAIGMTSYHGTVFFGFNADRDSVGDVDVLADLVEQQVDDLLEAAG
ncbi:WS/DGAT/MGAT family O-acyltransferase [Candidatus Blastococcus massiliensis]|uniref:WS/DGAT/MGAT family O-acyltransferase n=1 Tax=Candidatus Blastococcus massiliensis TaxID=1470358 RepID=UPI0004B060D0|nr:wax ester/triacylglycerol synthase family O-acyltransferase [Candidatus Blastococcus massiliensis]